ncbi:MAG TPA: aspartyl protease family protein [Pyrinomonadaceae bacterium]|nr:aspartyl protease family protein [Pyrinomonadaceae bacterium]
MKRHARAASAALASLLAFAALASPPASLAEGRDKLLQRAERELREGNFEEAEKVFREALSKDKQSDEARLGLSRALLKQRKNQDAFDQAARVVAQDPLSPRGHALLGMALLNSGDFRLSVEEFRTSLSIKGDDAVAVAGLAMVAYHENRLLEALEGLRRAAFIDPYEPDYLFSLGQVAARSERYKEAADAYERFLRIAPRTDTDRRERIRGLIDFLRYLGTQGGLLRPDGPTRNVIPFELINNRPVLKVRINNSRETLRFVLDSGAGMCVISTAAAEKMGLRAVARGGMARAIGGRFEIVYGFMQSLHVGDVRVDNVPVYIRKFFNEQEPVDGYVGLTVISKYLTSVDYGRREMTMLRGADVPDYDAKQPPPGVEVPIRVTSSGFWSGEVKFDELEKPSNFIIDTGASISVISEALATRLEALDRYAKITRIKVYGAAGVAEDVQMLNIPRVHIGPLPQKNVAAAVIDMDAINETSGFEQTGIVGGNVLRHFRVTFDFERAVVRLEPLAAATPDEKPVGVVTSQP